MGCLDVHELSQKLATIPAEGEGQESHGTNTPTNSEASSTAAVFGSELGVCS